MLWIIKVIEADFKAIESPVFYNLTMMISMHTPILCFLLIATVTVTVATSVSSTGSRRKVLLRVENIADVEEATSFDAPRTILKSSAKTNFVNEDFAL